MNKTESFDRVIHYSLWQRIKNWWHYKIIERIWKPDIIGIDRKPLPYWEKEFERWEELRNVDPNKHCPNTPLTLKMVKGKLRDLKWHN